MTASLRTWFAQLSPREQWLVGIAGGLAAIVLLIFGILLPAMSAIDNAKIAQDDAVQRRGRIEATVAAANYHSVEAASAAALGGCDAARKGAGACVIVAYIRPKGWQARSVQLSADATRAFSKDYGGKGAALAVSAGTGTWAMAKGATASEAAIAACGAKLSGPNDCTVVIAD